MVATRWRHIPQNPSNNLYIEAIVPWWSHFENGDLDWPPHSPDLTPPDFFLWGYLKLKVYIDKARRELVDISTETLGKAMENVEKRVHYTMLDKNNHLYDIKFRN